MSFLPRAPLSGTSDSEAAPPPVVTTNPYIQQKMPKLLLAEPTPPRRKNRADNLVQDSEQAFQRGKKAYQQNDIDAARTEFDAAVDMMLEAADENPADRTEYDNRLDDLVDRIHRLDLSGMGASAAVEQGRFEKAPLEDILQMTFPVDPKLKDKVREQVAATVSQLPLSVNDTVLGYINYFSNRGHKTIVAATQRSGRYRPMIQRILDEEGVPRELIHLAQAESGFIPRAVSRAAAGGMWQFLKWRGNQYGLTQTRYTDDRMDPEKATRAAAHHLRDLYSEFGDWYLAIAAYNCGPGVVERAVERTGYADFWELRSRGVLPAETTNYVPIILAMTIMEKNAADYGLEGLQLDPPIEYDTVETTAPTSLALVSDIADASVAQIAELNPAALRGMVPENFLLRVPKGSGKQIMASLQLVPAEHRDSWRMHQVASGETLSAIAKRYGAAPASIVAANKLASGDAMEGDRLLIPASLRPEVQVRTTRATASRSATARRPAVTSTQQRATHNTVTRNSHTRAVSTRSTTGTGATRKTPVIVARTTSR
ncbi:MAG TPA: transglycosylase SLT domain-containing protein [Bryobacteraceae bacterium]